MLEEVESGNIELSEAASELRAARDEAEQANLAKSQFLANMSHELRTPLNAIVGYTEVLQEELSAAGLEQSLEDVQWIYGSAKQLLYLINEILDLSKIEAGRMDVDVHEFDVNTVLREVKAMLEPMAEKTNSSLHLQIDPSITKATSDSTKLRQCLLNLGSNACKFTENGHVAIVVREEGDNLVFTVSDTGIGMSEEQVDRLFQPFVQADASTTRRYGGTGLGLIITWRLAEILGGRVDVDSSPGEGSTFTLHVKKNLGDQADAIAAESSNGIANLGSTGSRDKKRPVALIVDDEPSAVQLLGRFVDRANYDIVVANDGEAALEVAKEQQPDLIFLDIGIPKIDGWQVLDALDQDEALSAIPTVVVTVDDDKRRSLNAGAADHLVKPVDKAELAKILSLYSNRQAGRVLIVEDDRATARLYSKGIEQTGCETTIAHDGKDAIEALRDDTFDLVITDLRMPSADGFELIEEISKIAEDVRPQVIVVTGKVLDEAENARLDGRIVSLLPKNGLSPRKLADHVATVVGTDLEDAGSCAEEAA